MREGKEFKQLYDWGLSTWKRGRAISWEVEDCGKRFAAGREQIHCEFSFGCAKFEKPNLNIQVEFLYKADRRKCQLKKNLYSDFYTWEGNFFTSQKNILLKIVSVAWYWRMDMKLKNRRLKLKSSFLPLWTISYIMSLSLSVLICKMGSKNNYPKLFTWPFYWIFDELKVYQGIL